MIPLHSILAAEGTSMPGIVLAVAGVLLAIAFVVGFVKGFRKVGWDGLTWLVAGGAFFLIGLAVKPVGSTTGGSLAIAVTLALVCVGGALALHGLATYFLRPKMRWIKDDVSSDMSLAEYGLEFEPEYLDYDGEHDAAPYGKRIYKTGYGTPSFFARLMGGLTCVINVGMVLWALLSAFLLFVNTFCWEDAMLGPFLADENMSLILDTGKKYLLDFLMIAVIIFIAKLGQKKGFFESVRTVVITIGSFAAIWFSFYWAFTVTDGKGLVGRLVENCANIFVNFGAIGGILGDLLAGSCLLGLFSILLVILNVLLKKFCAMISGISITRGLDSCLACALYMLIGVVACVGIWCVLATLDVLEVCPVSSFIDEGECLSRALFDYAKLLVEPIFVAS